MRRLRFQTHAAETVAGSPALTWAWTDRLPEALEEFAFVKRVRRGQLPGSYVLELGPVGYGKVSMTLSMEMAVSRDPMREIVLQSLPGAGNADATVRVAIRPTERTDCCELSISLDVSPHKPAAAFWPRELIEQASSASLRVAAGRMLGNMKQAIEARAAAEENATAAEASYPGALSAQGIEVDRDQVA